VPWSDLLTAIGSERFAQIGASLAAAGTDDLHRDAFLLDRAVAGLLRDLMPDEAPADAITAYGALLHMLHVCWARDWPLVSVAAPALRAALPRTAHHAPRTLSLACYVQLPERLVWAEPVDGEAHEPLDGVFLVVTASRADALAVLGFRAGRDGFTTMEGSIALPAPPPPARADGAAAFTTTLAGGDRKQLLSVLDAHELCALALGALDAAEQAPAG